MMVIDASVFVSYMLPHDVNHEKAYKWLENHSAKEAFLTPEMALIEIACVLTRANVSEELINEWLLWFKEFTLIAGYDDTYSAPSTEEIILAAKKTGCRAGDTFYVAVAQKYSIPLVTFDKDQFNRAHKIGVKVISP